MVHLLCSLCVASAVCLHDELIEMFLSIRRNADRMFSVFAESTIRRLWTLERESGSVIGGPVTYIVNDIVLITCFTDKTQGFFN